MHDDQDDVKKPEPARFLYFIDGETELSEAVIEQHSLGHAISVGAPDCGWGVIQEGPHSTGGGVIVGTDRLDLRSQKWWRRHSTSSVWIGYSGAAPGPVELLREETCGSNLGLELADGNVWLCPVARPIGGGTRLPHRYTLGHDGAPQIDVLDAYEEIVGIADRVFDSVTVTGGFGMSEAQMVQYAAHALGVNYRVSEAECRILGLLTPRTVELILLALMDYPTWNREEDRRRDAESKKGDTSPAPGG